MPYTHLSIYTLINIHHYVVHVMLRFNAAEIFSQSQRWKICVLYHYTFVSIKRSNTHSIILQRLEISNYALEILDSFDPREQF